MKDSEVQMLKRLNDIVVSPEEIFRVVEEGEEWRRDNPDSDGAGIFLIAQHYKGEPEKAQAVYFRMLAVAKLLDSEDLPGWVLPKQSDGAITAKEGVFRVAATHPLSFIGTDICFEQSTFLAKVLEVSEHEGEA